MVRRQMINIDEDLCNGCGLCVPACAEGALEIIDGKARVVSEVLCDGLGACLGECPEDALEIEWRDAPEFDEGAVEVRLAELGREPLSEHEPEQKVEAGWHEETKETEAPEPVTGCPGTLSRMLGQTNADERTADRSSGGAAGPGAGRLGADEDRSGESLLSHWPVQLTLANPMAPSFRHADLLIAADCAPVAYRRFHEDYLEGRSVVIACPKLDDARSHLEKLVQLFETARPQSVTVLHMEVPCCFGLVQLVREAIDLAGLESPVCEEVLSISGERPQAETEAARS